VNSSRIEHVLGLACSFVLHVAEWTALMLHILELVFVQEEELSALATTLE